MELHFTATGCHLPITYGITQLVSRLNPRHTGRYSIYRSPNDGGLSKPMPRVERATDPRWLRDRLRPAGLEPRPCDR